MKLVLLPGLDGTGDLFSSFIHTLPEKFQTQPVLYPFKEGLGYDVLTEYVLDILPSHEPFVLLAESFSGPIAVAIAAKKLSNMKGLILVNTFLENPHPTLLKLASRIPDSLLVQPPAVVLRWLLRKSERGAIDLKLLQDTMADLSPELIRSRLRSISTVNVYRDARDITCPLLVMRSISDSLVAKRVAIKLMSTLTQATEQCLDTNHFLLQALPAEAALHVAEFIDTQCISHDAD